MPVPTIIRRLVPHSWKRAFHERVCAASVHHLCGPRSVSLGDNQAAVTCLVKNGEFYIDAFLQHYTRLGFSHIFLLDNGSTDATVSIARQRENVSVFVTELSVGKYQAVLKKHLANACVLNGWCLDVDIDEFFDYPYSDAMGLRQLLAYLNDRGFTAVLTQMLDMFSEHPLSHLAAAQKEELRSAYRFYDISAVEKTPYRAASLASQYGAKNAVPDDHLSLYVGGIRKALYGINCLLTKHSLFRQGQGLQLFPHVHFVNRARLADVSCALLHYKLTSSALETSLQNQRAFEATSQGYRDFMQLVTTRPNYTIKQSGARELRTVNDLLENGFLYAGDSFRHRMRTVAATR